MGSRLYPVLLALSLTSRLVFAAASPEDPAVLNNLGSRLYAEGRYREAEAPLSRAMELWSEQQPAELEAALHNLAAVYRLEGRYAEALPLYQRAIRMRETRVGPADLGLLLPLNGLALLYIDMGDVRQSKSAADRAVSIAELHRSEQTPEAASDFSALGSILAVQSRYSEAKSWIGRALSLRNRLFGAESAESASTWMDLALVCRRERRFDDASRAYREALQIYRQAEDGSSAATALSGLASLLLTRHRYSEAGDFFEEAIATLEKGASPGLPEAGHLKAELADVRAAQKRTAEAVKLYREALGILEPAFGAESPRLLPVLESYAKALRAQQDYAGAASIDVRTMRIRVRQTLGRASASS